MCAAAKGNEVTRAKSFGRPELTDPQAQQIVELLSNTLEMYRAAGFKGDALYGQAMGHALFTLNQRVKPIGIVGTLTGRVGRFKDQALLEMFLLTRVSEVDIPTAFVVYAQWRLGLSDRLDLPWLKTVLSEAVARISPGKRASFHLEARQHDAAWLSLIEESTWQAPHDGRPLILDGVPI